MLLIYKQEVRDGKIMVYKYRGGRYVPWVSVRDSDIQGRGLFAERNFRAGAKIGKYVGKILGLLKDDPDEESIVALWKKDDASYIITLGNAFVDGSKAPQSYSEIKALTNKAMFTHYEIKCWPAPFVHMANDPRGTGLPPNVSCYDNGIFEADRDIKKDEELLLDYGDDYWEAFHELKPKPQDLKRKEGSRSTNRTDTPRDG